MAKRKTKAPRRGGITGTVPGTILFRGQKYAFWAEVFSLGAAKRASKRLIAAGFKVRIVRILGLVGIGNSFAVYTRPSAPPFPTKIV